MMKIGIITMAEDKYYSVSLIGRSAAQYDKIEAIKIIRSATSLGLKEAKDLVENTLSAFPHKQIVKDNLSITEAEELGQKLARCGVAISIKSNTGKIIHDWNNEPFPSQTYKDSYNKATLISAQPLTPNMEIKTRIDLAEHVIELLSEHGYPFGGYLRDCFDGTEFKDVDIYMPKKNLAYKFITLSSIVTKLHNAGLNAIVSGTNIVYSTENNVRLTKTTYEVRDPKSDISITVDVVNNRRGGLLSEDHPFTALDADVNSLWFDKTAASLKAHPPYTLDKVLKNIKNKKFETPAGTTVRSDRIIKLLQKGYQPIDDKNVPVSVIATLNEAEVWGTPSARKHVDSAASSVEKFISTTTDKIPQNKEIKSNMATTDSVSEKSSFKSELAKAGYRAAGREMSTAVRDGILYCMKDKGADDSKIAMAREFLESKAGEAAVSAMLGHGLPHAPIIGDDPRAVKLAEEFRVEGYAKGMEFAFGLIMQYILPNLTTVWERVSKQLPALTETEQTNSSSKMRVDSAPLNSISDLTTTDDAALTEAIAAAEAALVEARARQSRMNSSRV